MGLLIFSGWIGHYVLLKSFRLDDVICLPIWMVSNITRGYPSGSKMLFEDLTLKTLFATKGYPLVMCPPSCPRGLPLSPLLCFLTGDGRLMGPVLLLFSPGPACVASPPPPGEISTGSRGDLLPPPGFSHRFGVMEA